MAAPQSLYGLWIENEIIMSPLHTVFNVASGACCRTQALSACQRSVAQLALAGLSTTTPSGAANFTESGVTASNKPQAENAVQMEMVF